MFATRRRASAAAMAGSLALMIAGDARAQASGADTVHISNVRIEIGERVVFRSDRQLTFQLDERPALFLQWVGDAQRAGGTTYLRLRFQPIGANENELTRQIDKRRPEIQDSSITVKMVQYTNRQPVKIEYFAGGSIDATASYLVEQVITE